MAINVKFAHCNCENEEVDKSGEGMISDWTNDVPCIMLNTDILNPVLKLDSGKVGYNYAKIDSFGGRYYFVESCESIAGGHCILRCHVDVLYTYCSGILALTCFVSRNEDDSLWKKDEVDRLIPVSANRSGVSKPIGDNVLFGGDDLYLLGYF